MSSGSIFGCGAKPPPPLGTVIFIFIFWKCYHWWNGFLCKNGPNPFLLSEKMFQNVHKIHVFCVKKLIFFPLWDRLLNICWKKWRKFLPNPLGTVIFLNWKNMKKITIGIRRKKYYNCDFDQKKLAFFWFFQKYQRWKFFKTQIHAFSR